jgi:tetratricopeptide (TPR) repeat protein
MSTDDGRGREQLDDAETAAKVHLDKGLAAGRAGEFKKAICEYKAALEINPPLTLELIICWNCAFAIWHRPGFWEKAGITQSDYRDILAMRALLKRIISIFENNFRGEPELERAYGQIYKDAKKELEYTKGKVVIVPSDDGSQIPQTIPESTPEWFRLDAWFQEQQCEEISESSFARRNDSSQSTFGDLIWWLPDDLNPPKAIADMPLSGFAGKGITQATIASLKSAVAFMISPDKTTWYVSFFDVQNPMPLIEDGYEDKLQVHFYLDSDGRKLLRCNIAR